MQISPLTHNVLKRRLLQSHSNQASCPLRLMTPPLLPVGVPGAVHTPQTIATTLPRRRALPWSPTYRSTWKSACLPLRLSANKLEIRNAPCHDISRGATSALPFFFSAVQDCRVRVVTGDCTIPWVGRSNYYVCNVLLFLFRARQAPCQLVRLVLAFDFRSRGNFLIFPSST